MRIRKKKHLSERLEVVSDYLIDVKLGDRDSRQNTDSFIIDWSSVFGNNNPLWLEIGCGKGHFAVETARLNPEINFVAVEKVGNVMVSACEEAMAKHLDNIKFLNISAEYLGRYFESSSVSRLFLNFSCPYPKKRTTNRRLTNPKFLSIYNMILKPDAEIHQKTDNMRFFEYSLQTFSENGFALKNISLDLQNSGFEGNIMTEYEKKFTDLGMPIYRLEAYRKSEK